MKCYQAMALGWAMGVEERPALAQQFVGPRATSVMQARIAQLESENRNLQSMVDHLDEERAQWGREVDRLRDQLLALTSAPVTHLPDGYYDGLISQPQGAVSPGRLADIAREVAFLNESEHLEVTVHDELNATARPKRDDDYTAEALDRDVESTEVVAEPMPEPEAEPVRPPYPSWQERQAKVGVPGAWAKPEVAVAEEAAREYIDTHLVAAEGTRSSETGTVFQTYVTAPELLAGYEAWAKANGRPVVKATGRMLGQAATKSPVLVKKRQGPVHGGSKPMSYFGVKLLDQPGADTPAPEPAPEAPAPAPLSKAEQNRQQVEAMRKLVAASKTNAVEHVPEPSAEIPHGPDELAIKLAQLKVYGIGGEAGVSRPAAQAAVADLHPTGRDVWKWSPPETPGGVSDADLDATAYQLLVKCMYGLPDEYGYDYKDDVLATAGFVQEDVDSALRRPERVEIRPESWDREKRYPILGFYKGDVSVILGMRTPAKPRVIAAYWQALLEADTHRVNKVGGGGAKKPVGLPARPTAAIERLRSAGCEIPDPGPEEKPVPVTYKGQDLGKITTSRKTSKATVQSDYQRTLRKMQAIDRREASKVPA